MYKHIYQPNHAYLIANIQLLINQLIYICYQYIYYVYIFTHIYNMHTQRSYNVQYVAFLLNCIY